MGRSPILNHRRRLYLTYSLFPITCYLFDVEPVVDAGLFDKILAYTEALGKKIEVVVSVFSDLPHKLIFRNKLFYCPFVGSVFVLRYKVERCVLIVKCSLDTVPDLVGGVLLRSLSGRALLTAIKQFPPYIIENELHALQSIVSIRMPSSSQTCQISLISVIYHPSFCFPHAFLPFLHTA